MEGGEGSLRIAETKETVRHFQTCGVAPLGHGYRLIADSGYKGMDELLERPFIASEMKISEDKGITAREVARRKRYNAELQRHRYAAEEKSLFPLVSRFHCWARALIEIVNSRLKGSFPLLTRGCLERETIQFLLVVCCQLHNWLHEYSPAGGGLPSLRGLQDYRPTKTFPEVAAGVCMIRKH